MDRWFVAMPNKSQLRRQFVQVRDQIPLAFRLSTDETICEHLHQFITHQRVDWVGLYAAVGSEVSLALLARKLAADNICCGLPVMLPQKRLEFRRYSYGDQLLINTYGISQPLENQKLLLPTTNTILCLPALAVDHQGYRLGSGGGYYDRYLNQVPALTSIAVVYKAQLITELPHQLHDQPVTSYCTQEGVVESSK